MTTPASGTIYGVAPYGTSTYGLSLPSAYQCASMSAASADYGTVAVTWTKPTSPDIFRWRLVSNRYGYPVDENDGNVVFDETTYPGSSYLDQTIIPGTYHYYGLYVLADIETNLWVRSGFAACLAPVNYGSSAMLLGLMPTYFQTEANGGALTDDVSGNSRLVQFLNVLGWMWDYIKTQYDVLANHLNDPMFIPLDDLWNMAAEVGLTFSPDVPAYTVRKAVANQAVISQNRGTIEGITQEINIRTGWGADIQVGPNILLVDDQAQFLNPIFEPYSPSQVYRTPANSPGHPERSCVWVPLGGVWTAFTSTFPGTGFWYQCATDSIVGIAPPVDGSSNGDWTCVGGPLAATLTDDFIGTLSNPVTNSPSTWEVLDPAVTATNIPPAGSLTQGLGVLTPGATPGGTNYAWNSLRLYNQSGSTSTLMLRSVSRTTQDLYQIPDPGFEAGYALSYVWTQTFNGYNTYYGDYSGNATGVPWLSSTWPLVFHTNYSWDGVEEESVLRPGFWAADNCLYQWVNSHAAGAEVNTGSSYSVLVTPYFNTGCRFGSPWISVEAGVSVIGSLYVRPFETSTAATTVLSESNGGVLGSIATWSGGTLVPGILFVSSTAGFPPEGGTATVVGSTATETITFTGIGPGYLSGCEYVSGTSTDTVATSAAVTLVRATVYAGIEWYDQYGAKISSSAGTASTPSYSAWTEYTVTATAPANTAYADVHLAWTGTPCANDATWVDDTSLVPQAVTITTPPEIIQAVQDGIPVPWVTTAQVWNATTQYGTNDIVSYGDQPFVALTASTGVTPPTTCVSSVNWAPLSQDPRIRLMLAAEFSQDLTSVSDLTAQVIPFVEWYDQQGNFIDRVFSRNPNSGGGVVAHPGTMTFDSFTTPTRLSTGTSGGGAIAPGIWEAQYFGNTYLGGPVVAGGTVSALDIDWGRLSPAPGLPGAGWSAQFTGSFAAPATGTYTLTSTGYGGVQVFINGTELVDNWVNPVTTEVTSTFTLTAGETANIVVNFYAPQETYSESLEANVITAPAPVNNVEETWTSAQFPVASGYPYLLEVQTSALTSAAQITWYAQTYSPQVQHGEVYSYTTKELGIETSIDGGRTWAYEGGAIAPWHLKILPVKQVGILTSSTTGQKILVTTANKGFTWSAVNPPSLYYAMGTSVVNLDGSNPDLSPENGCYFDPQYGVEFGGINVFDVWSEQTSEPGQGAVNLTGLTPAGAVYGVLYVKEAGTWLGIGPERTQSYQQFLTLPGPDATIDISMTSPVVASGTVISSYLDGRTTDDELCTWNNQGVTHGWTIGGYGDGTVWPTVPATRSVAVVSGAANANIGITFRTEPLSTYSQGLVFRYSDGTDYWKADRTSLFKKVSGIWYLAALHSVPFQDNDRMTVSMNDSVITVYRNGVEVSTTTDAFNDTATLHGITNELLSIGGEFGVFADVAKVKVSGSDSGRGTDGSYTGGNLAYRATPAILHSLYTDSLSIAITAPAGIAAGDLIILGVMYASGNGPAYSCPGFTAGVNRYNSTTNRGFQILTKIATGTETEYTVKGTTPGGFTIAHVVIEYGMIDSYGSPNVATTAGTTVVFNSVNVSGPGEWVLCIAGALGVGAGAVLGTSETPGTPSGFVSRAASTGASGIPGVRVADNQNAPAGATGTVTSVVASSTWGSQMVSIK